MTFHSACGLINNGVTRQIIGIRRQDRDDPLLGHGRMKMDGDHADNFVAFVALA
jgi:hypothetical protein